ncbi:hypothetical protein [Paracoccus sp. NSM]|uniref:hypothetical protein n=1 Tax=Paracoccus sp. NSM TaxID=3457784 RepID=UPI0040357B29
MNDMTPAAAGHNNPPPYDPETVAALEQRVRDLADAGGAWLDLGKIEDEEQAGKLNDFLAQARQCAKQIEDARKTAKQPHMDAATAVDAKFKTLTGPLTTLGVKLKDMLGAFAAEKQRKLDEERRRAQEEARRAQEEADRLRREAEARNDVIAQAEAEERAKAAEKAAKAAEKPARAQIASATGGGRTMATRTTYRAEIKTDSDARRAFGWLLADPESRPALLAEMERLCTAARRRKDGPTEINGVTFIEQTTVA